MIGNIDEMFPYYSVMYYVLCLCCIYKQIAIIHSGWGIEGTSRMTVKISPYPSTIYALYMTHQIHASYRDHVDPIFEVVIIIRARASRMYGLTGDF